MFIAIIGSRAAGKTSARKYLETKGFRHVRVSSSEEVKRDQLFLQPSALLSAPVSIVTYVNRLYLSVKTVTTCPVWWTAYSLGPISCSNLQLTIGANTLSPRISLPEKSLLPSRNGRSFS